MKFERVLINYLLIVVSFFSSCENHNKPKETDPVVVPKDSTANTQAAPDMAMSLTGELHTLKLSKQQFNILIKHIPPGPKPFKIIFQFYFDDADPKSPMLIAYSSIAKNELIKPVRSSILKPDQPFFTLPKLKILGDQQLIIQNLVDYIDAVTNHTGNYTNIIFSPDIDTNNHIYYKITLEGVASLLPPLETNPSPPKDAD